MDSFFLDAKGVWFQKGPNSQGESPAPIWVCSPLEIIAITRDDDNQNHGKLLRFYDYDGIEHRVLVLPDGEFEYASKRYPSLSMIARTITGTRWSGPAFFGLRKGARR